MDRNRHREERSDAAIQGRRAAVCFCQHRMSMAVLFPLRHDKS
jgi:hypothetical protein